MHYCQCCGAGYPNLKSLDRHHIVPRGFCRLVFFDNKEEYERNIVRLCKKCHLEADKLAQEVYEDKKLQIFHDKMQAMFRSAPISTVGKQQVIECALNIWRREWVYRIGFIDAKKKFLEAFLNLTPMHYK